MPAPYQPPKPLWRFGWRGWCLLPALFALIGVTWSGYDLRFQLQSLIARTLGFDAMFSFTAPGLTAHAVDFYWLLNPTPELFPPYTRFGLLSASIIAISLTIHPHRSSTKAMVAILTMGFLVPIVHWITPSWTARQLGYSWPLKPGLYANAFVVGQLIAGTLVALPVLCISLHSRALSIFVTTWLALGLLLFVEMLHAGQGMPALLVPLDVARPMTKVLHWSWHAILLVTMFTWSIRARLHHIPPHACQHCAYDLRGLPPSATLCPECGQPTAHSPSSAHAALHPNEKTGEPQGPPVQNPAINKTEFTIANRP